MKMLIELEKVSLSVSRLNFERCFYWKVWPSSGAPNRAGLSLHSNLTVAKDETSGNRNSYFGNVAN